VISGGAQKSTPTPSKLGVDSLDAPHAGLRGLASAQGAIFASHLLSFWVTFVFGGVARFVDWERMRSRGYSHREIVKIRAAFIQQRIRHVYRRHGPPHSRAAQRRAPTNRSSESMVSMSRMRGD
jgi:hypothetical protein